MLKMPATLGGFGVRCTEVARGNTGVPSLSVTVSSFSHERFFMEVGGINSSTDVIRLMKLFSTSSGMFSQELYQSRGWTLLVM